MDDLNKDPNNLTICGIDDIVPSFISVDNNKNSFHLF